MCYRVLADLDVEMGHHQLAVEHYHEALRLARSVAHLPALIEVLLAQGRLAAQVGEIQSALNSLSEALRYAVDSDYRLYEVDSRVALALTYLKMDNLTSAHYMVDEALKMSNEIGYNWGKIDAAYVLKELES